VVLIRRAEVAGLRREVPDTWLPQAEAPAGAAVEVVKAYPSDNVYLATALAGGTRWVVSENTRHLTPVDGYAGLRIVEPAVFLAELDAQG
jgi:hypothetical protein